MKKALVTLSMAVMCSMGHAQDTYTFTIDSQFKPQTFEEMWAPFRIMAENQERIAEHNRRKAEQERRMEQLFDEYQDKAYECYNKGEYSNFIYYSNKALNTGWYNEKLYYDRGIAFEKLHDYDNAKEEYKKAKEYGYQPAEEAYKLCKEHQKEWERER